MNNNASDGCISHQLGSSHEWPPYPRSVEWSPSHMAHQLLEDAGHVSSTQTLSTRPEKSPCVGAHPTTQRWSSISITRVSAFVPLVQAGAPDPLAESSSYSWASEYGSRYPVEAGAEARGMDASPRGEADMESFGPGSGGSVCDLSDIVLCPLVLSDSSSSAGAGCYGTDLAETSSVRLCCTPLLCSQEF